MTDLTLAAASTPAEDAPAAPPRPARSLRLRILAVVAAIDVACCLAAVAVTVFNAREATRVEIAASLELAEPFVRETLLRLQRDVGRVRSIEDVQLSLPGMRHVRISVLDASGAVVAAPEPEPGRTPGENAAPEWFAGLIASAPERREIPVVINGQAAGRVVIHGEASDEVAEVWEDLVSLAVLFAILNALALVIFAAALGRVLAPLGALAEGLSELERRKLDRRLPAPPSLELAALAERFNALADALASERATNARLSRRMVTLQDDERRQIANELHDELGPCLFGLRANLASLERDVTAPAARDRVRSMIEISERLSDANRRLLRRLRPMALGEAPLADVLAGLIADFERHHPERTFTLTADGLADGYGEAIDLTVYRCVQEGVTNALRHGDGSLIDVSVAIGDDDQGDPAIVLRVKDDGDGVPEKTPPGFGLMGLGERLQALGGSFRLEGAPGGGATLAVRAPLDGATPRGGRRP
ncbi:histidine kinase [Methylopila turkensis]|uniref:Sensor histidine kinase n=1 Tax=Methylopila turkensis TaxID=1437816 RepID=A0A9W6JN81_9HYPH|nr:histidine kinase [Methylopila turkensis]GLK80197.1 sensor histidine kinase [Methylopila turkensis]